MGSWEELDRSRVAEPAADEFTRLCGSVFSAGTGAELLAMFRAMTIEKTLPDGASEAQLRALEAQRSFVRRIEVATARGQAKPKG